MAIADAHGEPPAYGPVVSRPSGRRHEEFYFEDGNLVLQVCFVVQ